jgi:DNA (cytosine-5)-methyltransferase 1
MEIVFGLDVDPDAAATFRWNFPEAQFLQTDLTRLRANQLQSLVSAHRRGPILFCGCAP